MRKTFSFLLVAAMTASMASNAFAAEKSTGEPADLIYYGSIFTANDNYDTVEAMAVKDGKIVYVGDKAGAESYKGDDTKVEDCGDNSIIPGFIDGHVHVYIDGENQKAFKLGDCPEQTKEAYLEAIRTYVEEHPDEEIYRGFGWLDTAFIGETPTREMLDEICPDKPIYIKSEDCHSCWINTKMLEMTPITKDTEDPIGGKIERDKEGNPNGCIRDTAMDLLVKPSLPPFSVAEYEEYLKYAQNKMVENGYTTYNDVLIEPESADHICEAYYNLAQKGELITEVNLAVVVNNSENYVKDLEHIIELRDKFSCDQVKISDVKIFMDGIVESKTAFLSKPYENSDSVGADRWPGEDGTERLYDLAKRINDAGMVAHFHAIGDAAITKAIDAIEYTRQNSENKDIRNVITHLQMISDKDIQRMADLNIIASCDLGWAPQASKDVGQENIEGLNVGKERNDAMYPFASMFYSGVYMAYATDFPANLCLDPVYNMQAGISRKIFSIDSTARNTKEAIYMEDALEIMTNHGAYQLGREKETGTLEVGKEADFIVFSDNLFELDYDTVSLETIHTATYSDGKLVYSLDQTDTAK